MIFDVLVSEISRVKRYFFVVLVFIFVIKNNKFFFVYVIELEGIVCRKVYGVVWVGCFVWLGERIVFGLRMDFCGWLDTFFVIEWWFCGSKVRLVFFLGERRVGFMLLYWEFVVSFEILVVRSYYFFYFNFLFGGIIF